uniref:Coiled-coil domain-containing protein 177-like n=1 Tax=Sinocyclocheilus rhinocerous TaxID=307959 RepID=A0A673NQV5_9TELE
MVDPLEPDDQSKFRGAQFESPTAASEAPCLPEPGDDREKDVSVDSSPQTEPSTEPVLSPQEPCQQQNSQPEELKLHLDLYNFDTPAAEGSRYVLTSPRSLEACARCGVKPVELLLRPLSDFAREAPGRSMRVATGMFEIYERDRHAKLRHCREERERIIREEKRRIFGAPKKQSTSTAPKSTTAGSGQVSTVSTSSSPPISKASPVNSAPTAKGTSARCRSHSLESLQRRRDTFCSSTASTTNTTTTTCTSSESASSSYSWDGARDHWAKTSSSRARTLATFNSLMGRSLSLGDLSHSPQTMQKVERIVKEVKRRGLKAVPERDRKIAALMLARYQEEDIMSQTRYVAHLQWDSERRIEELRREREEREKQRAVQQCQRAWQSQVSTRQRWLNQQECEAAEAKLRQALENEERWKELAEQQERSRSQKLQQAAREEKHKKALQEQNLKALEEERAAILEQEKLLLKEKLTIAELKRQEREHQIQEERRGLNRAEKRHHAALIQEIARREVDEREEAWRIAEEKLSRSLENYEQIQEKRGQELKEKAKREEKQIQKARRAAELREQQQKEQMEAKAREAERRAQQASQVAEERAREKSQRVVQSRKEKERLQRLNRQRVEEEEKQRRLELLQSIERKLEKSEQIFREKRAVLESARSVARASFHVRDRVREETNMRTFDKMALEAQLNANLVEK